jgi:N-terminal domain of toast_rack, DUF2154
MFRFAWLPVALLAAACSMEPAGETRREQQSIELDGATSARVNLEMGAGELRISSGAAKLMEAEFTYNVDRLKPMVEHHANAAESEIRISQAQTSGLTVGAMSRWDLRLNDAVVMDIVAKLGAGEAEMNLGSLTLRNLEVGIGAGQVHVDLRGTPKRGYAVRISGGVGQTVVYLPRSAGISATAAGGLGSISVNGLEKRGERWINAGHENDPVQITVNIKGGIGEIQVNAQ